MKVSKTKSFQLTAPYYHLVEMLLHLNVLSWTKQYEFFKGSAGAGNVMVGLFDSLRDLTQNVGKLVSIVGDRLDDSRGDVVRIASDVDTQVPFSYKL